MMWSNNNATKRFWESVLATSLPLASEANWAFVCNSVAGASAAFLCPTQWRQESGPSERAYEPRPPAPPTEKIGFAFEWSFPLSVRTQ
jgi:hypothetical protein